MSIDSVYYRNILENTTAMRSLKAARTAIFNLFINELKPCEETRILDIGVSDDENDGANFLEKSYPWQHNITCAGLGNGEAVVAAYPKVSFQRIEPGARLPFEDQSFDIAYSNAVIEHVGGSEQRTAFIAEHLRVAKAVFITFPNRWFPVEHHSGLPLLHYSPRLFRKLLKGTRYEYWVDPANLDFLDRRTIQREWPRHANHSPLLFMSGLSLGPFSSNCVVISHRNDRPC